MAEAAVEQETAPRLRVVPEPPDLLSQAIDNPVDIRAEVPPDEQRMLLRRDNEMERPGHIATTIVLRCAGVEASIYQYDAAVATSRELAHIRTLSSKKPSEKEKVRQQAEAAENAAAQYLSVHAVVERLAGRYAEQYAHTHEDMDRLIAEIYDPTEAYDGHPLIQDITKYRGGVLKGQTIHAERVLRLLLLARPPKPPESD